MELLRLAALDAEDLTVISAHLQDAVLRPADLTYLAGEHRFLAALRRFDWSDGDGASPRRRLAGLHVERVLGVRTRGFTPGDDAPLSLLALTFAPTDAPSGRIDLVFSGDAAIRLDVECVEVRMKDLGPVWEAGARPGHEAGADAGADFGAASGRGTAPGAAA